MSKTNTKNTQSQISNLSQAPISVTPKQTALIITGISSYLGSKFLASLLHNPDYNNIFVFDAELPKIDHPKIKFFQCDLTHDGSEFIIIDKLKDLNLHFTFVHGLLHTSHKHDVDFMREIESGGTWRILNAVAGLHIQKLIVLSDTFVYGPQLGGIKRAEFSPIIAKTNQNIVKFRLEVERQLASFAIDYPKCKIITLRFAPVIGPNCPHSDVFFRGLKPISLETDPYLQFIHEEDAVQACLLALNYPHSGVFNIVGKGLLPLSSALNLSGRKEIPGYYPAISTVKSYFSATKASVIELFTAKRTQEKISKFSAYWRYICPADGLLAQEKLGFVPRFTCRQAFKYLVAAKKLQQEGFPTPGMFFNGERNDF